MSDYFVIFFDANTTNKTRSLNIRRQIILYRIEYLAGFFRFDYFCIRSVLSLRFQILFLLFHLRYSTFYSCTNLIESSPRILANSTYVFYSRLICVIGDAWPRYGENFQFFRFRVMKFN